MPANPAATNKFTGVEAVPVVAEPEIVKDGLLISATTTTANTAKANPS